jgi:hypothetical protein
MIYGWWTYRNYIYICIYLGCIEEFNSYVTENIISLKKIVYLKRWNIWSCSGSWRCFPYDYTEHINTPYGVGRKFYFITYVVYCGTTVVENSTSRFRWFHTFWAPKIRKKGCLEYYPSVCKYQKWSSYIMFHYMYVHTCPRLVPYEYDYWTPKSKDPSHRPKI